MWPDVYAFFFFCRSFTWTVLKKLFKRFDCFVGAPHEDYLQTFGPRQMKSLLLPGASEGQISNVHGGVPLRSIPSSSDDHQHTCEYVPFDFAPCGRGTGGAHIKWLQRRERGSVLILCSQKGSPRLHLITANSRCWCWWCSVPFHPRPSTPLKVDGWGGSLTADMLRSRKWAS